VGQSTSGDSSSISLPGGGVVTASTITVSAEENKPTVSELARKILPIINTLKAEVAALQLALSVLPSVEQAVKELKEGYMLLKQQCDGYDLYQAKTDAALKLLNQASLAYDFLKLPRNVVTPLNAPGMPTMWYLSNEVVVDPAPHVPNTLMSPPSGDLSMLDFDTFFQ